MRAPRDGNLICSFSFYTYNTLFQTQCQHVVVVCAFYREFFANRAAAQAVKAKVEAYDRSGGERLQMPLQGAGAGPGVMGGGGGVGVGGGGNIRSQPNSRRGSEVDPHGAAAAAAAAEESDYYNRGGGGGAGGARARQSYDEEGFTSAEARIAHLKAQREREKERENAENAMKVSEQRLETHLL